MNFLYHEDCCVKLLHKYGQIIRNSLYLRLSMASTIKQPIQLDDTDD